MSFRYLCLQEKYLQKKNHEPKKDREGKPNRAPGHKRGGSLHTDMDRGDVD